MELGTALAAVVAAALHGRGQLVRPAKGADKQRYQNGNQRLGLLEQASAFKVRAAGLLRRYDLVRFLDQRGNEPQGNGHHHGQLMHRHMDFFQGIQQGFQTIRQSDGAGGIGHQEGSHHQQHDADHHEQSIFNALYGDPQDSPFPKVMGIRRKKNIQHTGEHNNDHQWLQTPHQRLQSHMGDLYTGCQRGDHHSIANQPLSAEEGDDIQRYQQDFGAGVQLVGNGISRKILA